MLFQMVMRIMIFHFGFTLILVADGPHEGHIRSSQAQSFPHKKLKSIAWVRRPSPREHSEACPAAWTGSGSFSEVSASGVWLHRMIRGIHCVRNRE